MRYRSRYTDQEDDSEEDDEPVWFAESFVYWLRRCETVLSRIAPEARDRPGAHARIEAIAARHVREHKAEVAALVRHQRREARRKAEHWTVFGHTVH